MKQEIITKIFITVIGVVFILGLILAIIGQSVAPECKKGVGQWIGGRCVKESCIIK